MSGESVMWDAVKKAMELLEDTALEPIIDKGEPSGLNQRRASLPLLNGDSPSKCKMSSSDGIDFRKLRASMYGRVISWINESVDKTFEEIHTFKEMKIENVRLVFRNGKKKPPVGTLYLTTTHLIFVDAESRKETWITLPHIGQVIKLPLSTVGAPLQIRCKTFLSVTFIIVKERDCHDLYVSLTSLCQPVHIEGLYCFHYTPSRSLIRRSLGWYQFDIQAEYQRFGVPNQYWSLTNLNKDYELCDTYPKYLYAPSGASSAVIIGSSKFRSKGRFPVLSYLHSNGAALCRCSQPLSGFSARCLEDEQLMASILQANPRTRFMYVVDTRPRINAMANRAAGKGYENEAHYSDIKFMFFGIENIHVMRSSLNKLSETCELKDPSINTFLNGLQSCGWLRHIKAILDTSHWVATSMEEGFTVLVHCSDGWDRTAQVCAIAALLLDPFYRTIHGFQALIEKEWLAFGHKFTDRCGFLQTSDSKEISPVFGQFLDCIWQLTRQFPTAFQFSEKYLIMMHDYLYSCQYGTFIGNCEKDRVDLRVSERTYSLWGFVSANINDFLNPFYLNDKENQILRPDLSPSNIQFWRGLYCRFDSGIESVEPVNDIALSLQDQTASLQDHVKFLKKRIISLAGMLGSKKEEGIVPEQNGHHCWSCGEVICQRCLFGKMPLPGHASFSPVPTCRECAKRIRRCSSSSLQSP
ncbi:myotubularin-related protein 8-like isoform X3 [Artemia franciscana]|uniref:myotubularin-related protein 8-like isoform X3 n=1 Tax=Artemia franciscana TaxID=6661 RepID=UPI0032DA02FF